MSVLISYENPQKVLFLICKLRDFPTERAVCNYLPDVETNKQTIKQAKLT